MRCIHPKHQARPGPESEKRIWHALAKHLPHGWAAFHSLKLRTKRGYEGEGDFVLAAPQLGLLVLEVKGGRIELVDGHWFQNGHRLVKSPRAQAQTYVRHLVDALAEKCGQRPPFGVACAFPDCEFDAGPTTGDLDGLVIGQRDLPYLAEVLPALFARALPPGGEAPKNDKWMKALLELWGETWVPTVGWAGRLADLDRRQVQLDEEQLALLSMFEKNPRAVIQGGAGSGKTLIAREICIRQARAGKRVLYVCFTDALARAVDDEFHALREAELSIRAIPIRRYAKRLLGLHADSFNEEDPEAWRLVTLEAALDSLPDGAQRPDWVVVDEGQDLEASDWDFIQELVGDQPLWIFHDPEQAFWRDRQIPAQVQAGATQLHLPNQKRTPPAVEQFASLFLGTTKRSDAQQSSAPDVIRKIREENATESMTVISCTKDPFARIEHELNELRKKGVPPSAIAIISLAGQTKSDLLTRTSFGSHRVLRADDRTAKDHIVADTFLRFKGLERPVVLITEVSQGRASVYDTRMYMALTRASVAAKVICWEEQAKADHRLAALAGVE